MDWTMAQSPESPQGSAHVQKVPRAFLSKLEHGPLAAVGRPNRYLRGAVYSDTGQLVTNSQKIGGLNDNPWVTADAGKCRISLNARELFGSWLYGGHWMQHFGHFICETLPTLWPEPQAYDGLVFHKYHRRPVVYEPWMLRLLELAGYGKIRIEVVGKGRAARVDLLTVPSRTVVAGGWALPEARNVWDRVAASCARGLGAPRVYLSRSRFNAKARSMQKNVRTSPERDHRLDRVFQRAGFRVVFPEELTIDEQLIAVSQANIIAGPSGSALHLTAFAPRGTNVIEIGDPRNPIRALNMQLIIDSVGEHPHQFIPAGVDTGTLATLIDRL